jgi:GAF domain-containing protein
MGALRAEATSCDVLDRLLTLTTETFECDHATATLTVQRPGAQTTLATDADLLVLADLQLLQGAGPAVDAVAGQSSALVLDLRSEDRWPSWAAAATRAGLRSLICVPLTCTGARLGTLTAYDTRRGHFTAGDVATAGFMARFAAAAVAAARDHEDLWRVIDARRTIACAQGILMQRDGLDPDRAIVLLRDRSARQRLTLQVVAERLVRAPASLE